MRLCESFNRGNSRDSDTDEWSMIDIIYNMFKDKLGHHVESTYVCHCVYVNKKLRAAILCPQRSKIKGDKQSHVGHCSNAMSACLSRFLELLEIK